jgi:hypothetical protein
MSGTVIQRQRSSLPSVAAFADTHLSLKEGDDVCRHPPFVEGGGRRLQRAAFADTHLSLNRAAFADTHLLLKVFADTHLSLKAGMQRLDSPHNLDTLVHY